MRRPVVVFPLRGGVNGNMLRNLMKHCDFEFERMKVKLVDFT